jgi:exodeoxyribonuclease VII small subunit
LREAIEKLEEITSALEGGDLSLDQGMARYEEGLNWQRYARQA